MSLSHLVLGFVLIVLGMCLAGPAAVGKEAEDADARARRFIRQYEQTVRPLEIDVAHRPSLLRRLQRGSRSRSGLRARPVGHGQRSRRIPSYSSRFLRCGRIPDNARTDPHLSQHPGL